MDKDAYINSMSFTDNHMFQSVMKNKAICKEVIELFLGFKLKDIAYPEVEKSVLGRPSHRSVRFDVYAEDENGNAIDIEMQTVNEGDLPERSRYYQSMIDQEMLRKGIDDYENLKHCCIIFLCAFNPFGGKKKVYRFRMREDEDHMDLGDKALRIFACTEGEGKQTSVEILRFLSYLKDRKPTDELTKRIDEQVAYWKGNREWRETMWENHWEEWRLKKEGKAEAEASFAAEQKRLFHLIELLKRDGKADLALDAVTNQELRDELYREYHIGE